MENLKDPCKKDNSDNVLYTMSTSLSTLIVWNVSKALEKNPELDIKDAIALVQCRLEQVSDAEDIQALSEQPHERHLACALLAWQQLGHNHADSLYRFFENKKNEEESTSKSWSENMEAQVSKESKCTSGMGPSRHNSYLMGPVVKLPVETKTVMRVGTNFTSHACIPQKGKTADILSKISQACCMESVCAERLSNMDATIEELRSRAGMLAHREAERVELLERAEAAWRDLELGYQRRLTLAEEKEDDLTRNLSKAIQERNENKNACSTLACKLNGKSQAAETDRTRFNSVEKQLCGLACERLKLSEESAKVDGLVSEQSCRIAQLDRDLQFKEEQARRKVKNLESEVESTRALAVEAERAMRSELGVLRDQIASVSQELLEEAALIEKTKIELEDLRTEKMEIVEDLEGCKELCDGRMQGKIDELNQKREMLASLKEKVLECRCRLPCDVCVEVKRTPSLVALCGCSPEDKLLESCSCTSLRTRLLSDLLAELFSGLQSELGGSVAQMPCQLLKCLEDKHNWDRASSVKSNLKNYFSSLLVGELDIAIATSIENYRAKWVGESCADQIKMKPDDEHDENEGWQQRAIERRAQQLATKLAEQLFQERADELTMRAKDVLSSGPPPCSCKPPTGTNNKAAYPCLLDIRPAMNATAGGPIVTHNETSAPVTPIYWHQAIQDVTQLRQQIEDLKKDAIKKEDLKSMEDKFCKIIQKSSAGSSQEKGEEIERRAAKKPHSKIPPFGGEVKGNDGKVANVNHTTGLPCLVKKKEPFNSTRSTATPSYWQQEMQDVTQLRLQLEDLKKDSLKKEDLKMMEDKFDRIIQRASEDPTFTIKRKDNLVGGIDNEGIKKGKINRPVNHLGINSLDIKKPSTTTKKNIDSNLQAKKENKPNSSFRHGIDKSFKSYKRNEQTFAVNMCLCNTKQQKRKLSNVKSKAETSVWKQKVSKETVMSQMSSNVRQCKPINMSFISQDVSARKDSKESEESCPSNCVCFHKVPSNISIDKILETLAKWKCDLDASCNETHIHKNSKYDFNNYNVECILDNDNLHSLEDVNVSFKSKTSVKSQEMRNNKNPDSNGPGSKNKVGLEHKSKNSAKTSAKSICLIGTNDSEYMGAINLDKSNEDLCKCANDTIKNKKPFKCITSKCSCERILEARKAEIQIPRTKKQKEVQKPDRRTKEITVLDNLLKTKEKNKERSQQQPINSGTLNDAIAKSHVLEPSGCDYEIKFLGVTLADTKFGNAENKYKDKTILKNDMLSDERSLNKRKTSKVLNQNEDQQSNNFVANLSVTEFAKVTNSMRKSCRNVFMDKDNQKEYSNSQVKTGPIHKEIKTKGVHKTYNENEDIKMAQPTIVMHNCFVGSDVNELKNCKQYELTCELTKKHSNPETPNMGYENVEIRKKNSNISQSTDESGVLKKTFNTASEYIRLDKNKFGKIFGKEKDVLVHSNITEESLGVTKENLVKQKPSCECSDKFNEFKQFINDIFCKQIANEDVALDVQRSKDFKGTNESCVCCNALNTDDVKDLEENAFNLLEEYLKRKLDEFKFSSCSASCIPPEEEEKLFTIILQRVKELISDSTNQIACKCSAEEGKSQGSWNRAYGLLQEYLKMKIKKVQCSCLLAEDNSNTILPNVLEKISNLIEYDFERLKDVCGCKNNLYSQENAKKNFKHINLETNIPVKDTNVVLMASQNHFSIFSQTSGDQIKCSSNQVQTNLFQQSMSSQISLQLGMQTVICDPLEPYNEPFSKQASVHLFDKYKKSTCGNTNINKLLSCKSSEFFLNNNEERSSSTANVKEENNKNMFKQNQSGDKKKVLIFDVLQEQITSQIHDCVTGSSSKMYPYEKESNCNICKTAKSSSKVVGQHILNSLSNQNNFPNVSYIFNNNPVETNTTNNEQTNNKLTEESYSVQLDNKIKEIQCHDYVLKPNIKLYTNNQDSSSSSPDFLKNDHCCNFTAPHDLITENNKNSQKSEKNLLIQIENSTKYSNVPYVGCTLDCSCDDTLPCACSKHISKADIEKIENICRELMPDETYFKKISYILNSTPTENMNNNEKMTTNKDVYLQNFNEKNDIKDNNFRECETTISAFMDEQLVLKISTDNVSKTHANINTFEDNTSIDTDCSINDDGLDWSECCSHYIHSNKNSDSERLKSSFYFPAPLRDFNEHTKDDIISIESTFNLTDGLSKNACECELVPLCHVKMLVENIESRLATAKCTCDSMIPKVCPVHSKK